MSNICPNCGFEYEDNALFCSRCGYRIEHPQDIQRIKEAIEKTDSLESFMEEKDEASTLSNKSKEQTNRLNEQRNAEFFSVEKSSILNSPIFNFVAYLLIISFFLITILYVIITNQTTRRDVLQYRNMMNNPMQIPMLKDSTDYNELRRNFVDVERFLTIYLKYTKDTQSNKEQLFANYLKEANKLPHITSENMYSSQIKQCQNIDSLLKAQSCTKKLDYLYKNTGIKAYNDYTTVYLYPDYKFINKTYSRYLSDEFKQYLSLNAKYDKPTSVGLSLKISPKQLASKIGDFEELANKTYNPFLKDAIQNQMYYDFRNFIFNPTIYATTTQEMAPEFKSAYIYFINSRKKSNLTPVIMSYLDKQRSYSEDNFKNDYPYKFLEDSFDKNIQNSTFLDIFAQLRKNISNGNTLYFDYTYTSQTGRFENYNKNRTLSSSDFILSNPDENNNISIYTSTYSPFQELNIQRYSKPYVISGGLYVLNKSRLSLSKVVFNGKIFTTQTLNQSDITSLFPGVNVVNLDNQQSYNILLEKENRMESFIILSKYSQGFEDYVLTPIQGQISSLTLPNMFSVNSNSDIILSFHSSKVDAQETSESSPTYKFIVRTKGESGLGIDNDITNYDPETAINETSSNSAPKANMMPKINQIPKENRDISPVAPPSQRLEPPMDD